jgi:hypothetical protein
MKRLVLFICLMTSIAFTKAQTESNNLFTDYGNLRIYKIETVEAGEVADISLEVLLGKRDNTFKELRESSYEKAMKSIELSLSEGYEIVEVTPITWTHELPQRKGFLTYTRFERWVLKKK